MYVDLLAVKLFVDVIDLGSFTKASARNGLCVATVSERVERLEKCLSAVLLQRHAGGIVPTEAGVRFHQRVRAAFDDLGKAALAASGKPHAHRRHLTLCINEVLSAPEVSA